MTTHSSNLYMPDTAPLSVLPDEAGVAERRYGLLAALSWAVAIRIVIFLAGVASMHFADADDTSNRTTGLTWIAWDAGHYLQIINRGYAPTVAGKMGVDNVWFAEIAFFPLYPMLVKPFALLMRPAWAMLLVSNVTAVLGFIFMYEWVRKLTDSARIAFLSVIILSMYAGAVFFSAGLTEGPFFLLVAMTLWLIQSKKFWLAAVVSGFATLMRPTGVALAFVVGLMALLEMRHLPFPKRLATSMLMGVVAISGAISYELFLWHRYETPIAYVQAQKHWETDDVQQKELIKAQHDLPERGSLRWFLSKAHTPQAWNRILAVAFVIVMLAGCIIKSPIPRPLFALPLIIFIMTALPNHGLRASSIIRYESPGLPVFAFAAVLLAPLKRRPLLIGYCVVMFAMQFYYALLFTRGVWVG